jgi:hypothetical protein
MYLSAALRVGAIAYPAIFLVMVIFYAMIKLLVRLSPVDKS